MNRRHFLAAGLAASLADPSLSFLMYPCAVTADGELPCPDPAKFHYDITTREVTG